MGTDNVQQNRKPSSVAVRKRPGTKGIVIQKQSDAPPTSNAAPSPTSPTDGQHQPPAHIIVVERKTMNDPLGMSIDPETCRVKAVEGDGLAAQAGVETGCLITHVNGTAVANLSELRAAVGGSLRIEFGITVLPTRPAKPQATPSQPTGRWGLKGLMGDGGSTITLLASDFAKFSDELTELKREAAKAHRTAKELASLRKVGQQAAASVESRENELRRLKDTVAKSRAASDILALQSRIAELEQQREHDLANYKQIEAAMKVSLSQVQSEHTFLSCQLAGGTLSVAARIGVLTPEGMQEAIKVQQLKDRVAELEKEEESGRHRVETLRASLDERQGSLKDLDNATKSLQRQAGDLQAENAALQEEKKRLSAEIQRGNETYQETVKQLMDKVKSVGSDKERHVAEASEMLNRVQEEESAVHRKLADAEKELESLQVTNQLLVKNNRAMKGEEERVKGLLRIFEEKQAALRATRSAVYAAEQEVDHLGDALRQSKKNHTALQDRLSSLEADQRRLRNLAEEVKEVLDSTSKEHDEAVALREESQQKVERYRRMEAAGAALAAQITEAEKGIDEEHTRALQLMDQLHEREEALETRRAERDEMIGKVAELKEALERGRSRVQEIKVEIEQAKQQHATALCDQDTDWKIQSKKRAAKVKELQAQVNQARRHANEAGAQLVRLEERLRGSPTRHLDPFPVSEVPEEAPVAAVPSTSGDPSYLQLSDENCRLLEKIQAMQERQWAAEECRRSIEQELVRKQRELAGKDAELAHLVLCEAVGVGPLPSGGLIDKLKSIKNNRTIADHMQSFVEDTMLSNIKLRDQNFKLSQQLAALQGA